MQTTGKRVDRQPSKTSSISINEEELQDLRVEVVESIDTLFDLVQSLLRPAPHDRILDSLTEELQRLARLSMSGMRKTNFLTPQKN